MRRRRWHDILLLLEGRKKFDAGDLAGKSEDDLDYAGAAQMLRRLQQWGLVRVVGFAPAEHANPNGGHGGRRRKVYELTENGKKKILWVRSRVESR